MVGVEALPRLDLVYRNRPLLEVMISGGGFSGGGGSIASSGFGVQKPASPGGNAFITGFKLINDE